MRALALADRIIAQGTGHAGVTHDSPHFCLRGHQDI